MNFPRYNIANIFLTFVLTLGLLLGGRWVYQEFGVMGPLQKKLAEIPAVKETIFKTEEGKLAIELELGEVQSLNKSVQEIKELLPNEDGYALIIKDNRNDYLEELWIQNRFALEEAASLGNLTQMQELLKTNLEKANLDRWLLEVDGENLYLQMHRGNGYLYEIIPRQGTHLMTAEGQEWPNTRGR